MLSKVGFSDDDFCFVLGDVIDRGEDGMKILKWMMSQPNMELILGNNEAMMLSCKFLFDEITEETISKLTGSKLDSYLNWECNGARPTINALYSTITSEIKYILEYLHEAPLYETVSVAGKDFLLMHSDIDNFNKKLSEYSKDEFLWIRPKIDDRYFDDVITDTWIMSIQVQPADFHHVAEIGRFKGVLFLISLWINKVFSVF